MTKNQFIMGGIGAVFILCAIVVGDNMKLSATFVAAGVFFGFLACKDMYGERD